MKRHRKYRRHKPRNRAHAKQLRQKVRGKWLSTSQLGEIVIPMRTATRIAKRWGGLPRGRRRFYEISVKVGNRRAVLRRDKVAGRMVGVLRLAPVYK